MIRQASLWWVDCGELEQDDFLLTGERPAVVVQAQAIIRSRLATVLVVPLTANLSRAQAIGNIHLSASQTGLGRDSVVVPSQLQPIAKHQFISELGQLSSTTFDEILFGIDVMLGAGS